MKREAAEALEKSTAHHVECLKAETPWTIHLTGDECALCELFFAKHDKANCCSGCPVQVASKHSGCHGTPFYAAAEALRNWRYAIEDFGDVDAARNAYRVAEQREIDFLISLREPIDEDEGDAIIGGAHAQA